MKTLKSILFLGIVALLFVSCVQEDLHEDDNMLFDGPTLKINNLKSSFDTGGGVDEE